MADDGFSARTILSRLGAHFFGSRTRPFPNSSDEEPDSSDEDSMEEDSISSCDEVKKKWLEHELAQVTKKGTSASEGSLQFAGETGKQGQTVNTVKMLAGRELNASGNGRFSTAECCHMSARYLPSSPRVLFRADSRVYVGQFSHGGNLFIAGFQDRRIVIYDVEKGWSVRKNVIARNLRWTVTDTALSPDQRFLVYASITPILNLVNVGNESGGIESLANVTDIHEGLQFAPDDDNDSTAFGIWSVRFSRDGRELIAGANDNAIYVYDLEANRLSYRVAAHKDDVNAVAFADDSSNIIFSGSDDGLCKVWDRRCFTSKNKCAGRLVGHLAGITYIDSRDDGRHFISNSKDQTIKLWDIRKMCSSAPAVSVRIQRYRWDYRYMRYPARGKDVRHPNDASLMTYKGHEVLRTLIRCYFSPAMSTAQKYIYSGSHDNNIYIYDVVTGEIVRKLEFHGTTVRDCSWHPWEPMLVSSDWDGRIVKWEHSHT